MPADAENPNAENDRTAQPLAQSPAPSAQPAGAAAGDGVKLDLELLSIGLFALLLYLVCEAVDLAFVGFDVLHDAVGALLLLFSARCFHQRAVLAYRGPRWSVWTAAAARVLGVVLTLPFVSSVVPAALEGAVALVHLAALVAVAVTVRAICVGRGLASSARWRRVALLFALVLWLPAAAGVFFGRWPAVGLPLRFQGADGLVDAGANAVLYVASLLVLVDASLATVTTIRSARRRV